MKYQSRLGPWAPAALLVLLAACAAGPAARHGDAVGSARPLPPVAATRAHAVVSPFGARNDEYYWLRDDSRSNPEMLAYLKAENAYKDAMLAHTLPTQQRLFDEIVGRIQQDDATVPARKNGYWYYIRFEQGQEYLVLARRKGSMRAREEVLLDGNRMSKGHAFFQIGSNAVSRDGRIVAYTVDTVGRRQYTLRFKDLRTGRILPDAIPNVQNNLAWANDNRTILYIEKNPQTLLGYKVRKHVLGTAPAADPVVYEERDNTFSLGLWKSRSDRYLYIYASSTQTSEQFYADAGDPELAFKVLLPRERDHDYVAEEIGDRFVILTNWRARNFRVVEAAMERVTDRAAWRDLVPHRDDAFIQGASVFERHLVVSERSGGLRKIRIRRWSDGRETLIAADEPSYTMMVGDNPESDTTTLRYVYTSLTTPGTVYDVDMDSGARTLRKRDPVLGPFDPADYASELLWVPARDGAVIPVSLVYRKDFRRHAGAPLYQFGYGSYGSSLDPTFASTRLSLLDRGFVFALAHVRGGQELGRDWYESGRQLAKKNTFTDFIDVTEYLLREGYAAPGKVVACGRSAGGLLMGAVANMRPDLYGAVVAGVPFVDVVTTMLDASIPLTTGEFDEWGDPADRRYYDYMLSYSPYDNVAAQDYPAMLVTAGLWDSQVQYFEPAKWVARLRARNTGQQPLLFHINMEAGHGGTSGRLQRFRETAMEYAFLFDQLGVPVDAPAAVAAP